MDWTVMTNATRQNSAAPALDAMTVVQSRADALYRAARECCRQHDRSAKLSGTDEPELEHKHLDALCRMCDGSLAELSRAYEAAAALMQPGCDEVWWHKANGLWTPVANTHAVTPAATRSRSAYQATTPR